MTRIRLDNVIMTGLFEMWQNIQTVSNSLNISGTIPDGSFEDFTVELDMPDGFSIADVYAESSMGKTYLNNSPRSIELVYDHVSTETARVWVTYQAYTDPKVYITVFIVNNTGSSINLVNQTIEFSAVFYRAPILI